jgi:hypothetical protein
MIPQKYRSKHILKVDQKYPHLQTTQPMGILLIYF